MQFIDLAAQQERIKDRIDRNIQAVLSHGRYILGPEVAELEEALASYVGAKHAIGCSSGTDALLLALMTQGVGPGDIILTTPFTFVATAEVITLLGATPVFVDIDPATFNMDPSPLDTALHALVAKDPNAHPLPRPNPEQPGWRTDSMRPKAVLPVDLFGLPADYDPITTVANKHGLVVIEDAAQAFGGAYKGRKACALAEIGCTSFFPAKPLGAYGDGGMCFTHDDDLAEAMRSILVHGQGRDKYENVRIGINGRLDTIQAAVLLAKFSIFSDEVDRRQRVASRYTEWISSTNADLRLPTIPKDSLSAWAQYTVVARDADHRKALQGKLKEAGVPTAVYYPTPLHLQPAYSYLGYRKGDFPVSEDLAQRVFSLPMHPYLDESEQRRIAEILGGA